jgi:hypothetical protein
VGSGDTSGMVTGDSKTFRPDNLEFEVAGKACSVHIQYYCAGEK